MLTVLHTPEIKQINVLDNRYYTLDNENYYPSVTTILDVYPKGFGFSQWLKDVGNNASEIADRAAEQGSRVHNACELLAKGYELTWIDEKGEGKYSLEEWKMILKFSEFMKSSGAKIIHVEKSTCSSALGFGGTIDLVCEIGGKVWLIDYKSSNNIYKNHELQVAAYAILWNETEERKIDHTGILHLKAQTRTDKFLPEKKTIQGKGWQVVTYERSYQDAYKIFTNAHAIWKEENPVWKPLNQIYPDTIKL